MTSDASKSPEQVLKLPTEAGVSVPVDDHFAAGLRGFGPLGIFAILGLVFGTIFAVTGRIWMLMVAHAAFDVTALAMIYWDIESEVAHLIFK